MNDFYGVNDEERLVLMALWASEQGKALKALLEKLGRYQLLDCARPKSDTMFNQGIYRGTEIVVEYLSRLREPEVMQAEAARPDRPKRSADGSYM